MNGHEAYTDEHGKYNPPIIGALNNGVSKEVAEKIWKDMEAFASYAFNKSHAAAYSMVTYQTAYLKTYYKLEFITAILNNKFAKPDALKHYIAYAKQEKIEILPPDINLSNTYFDTDGKTIRYGLAALKNVGVGVINEIIREREENGPYKDLEDFILRSDSQALNKRCIESLIKAGAFDCFGRPRSQLMAVYSIMVDRALERKKKSINGQLDLFGSLIEDTKLIEDNEYPNLNEYVSNVKLQYEKEISGTYLSGHPLDNFMDVINTFTFNWSYIPSDEQDDDGIDQQENVTANFDLGIEEVEEDKYNGLKNGDIVTCGGVISDISVITTKTGSRMAFLTIEDLTGTFEATLFSKIYDQYKEILAKDSLVAIKGKFTIREGFKPSITVNTLELLTNEQADNSEAKEEVVEVEKPRKLCLKYNINDGILHDAVKKILSSYNGSDEVYIKDTGTDKAYKLSCMVTIRESLLFELETILDKSCIAVC